MLDKTEIRTVKTSAFEMDYFVFGSGAKNFIILPGLSLKSVMCSADSVAASYSAFANDYTVYVFDRKKNVEKGYTVRNMADDTAKAMKHIGITDAYIFGASQGGMIAMYIAIDYPELAEKMIIGSAAANADETSNAVIKRWVGFVEKGDRRSLNLSFAETIYTEGFREKYSSLFAATENDGTPQELARFTVLAESCYDFDVRGELCRIKCPVLVIGAKNDKVFTADASYQIAERIKDSNVYVYDDYGHAVYDEAEDYKDRIMRFFDSDA